MTGSRTTEHDKTEAIVQIRDMLLAHRAMGHDLDAVIRHCERTIERRLLKTLQGEVTICSQP